MGYVVAYPEQCVDLCCRRALSDILDILWDIEEEYTDENDAKLIRKRDAGGYELNGFWSDDFHHSVHAFFTGERSGYYQDFGRPEQIVRAPRSSGRDIFEALGHRSRTTDDTAGLATFAPVTNTPLPAPLPQHEQMQESIPRTPRVTTFPSATVGELRGPEKPCAGPLAPSDSYLSCQSSLPVAASRQRVISLASSRENTYTLSPTKAGVDTPSPTVTFHCCLSSLGQVFGAVNWVALASRLAPRHWGQSWAEPRNATVVARRLKSKAAGRFKSFMVVPGL